MRRTCNVDILMLTHNRLAQTINCIESLRPVLEKYSITLHVLDNGSSDGTQRYVADLPTLLAECAVKVTLQAENLGVAAGRQMLVKQATQDYVLFLDSDVIIEDVDFAAKIERWFEDEPTLGVIGREGYRVTFGQAPWQVPTQFIGPVSGVCDVVSGHCLATRRAFFDELIQFDTGYGKFWEEDSDLCMQVRALGYGVLARETLGLRHEHGRSGDQGVDQRLHTLARFKRKWAGMMESRPA